jgi:hypothetical protein
MKYSAILLLAAGLVGCSNPPDTSCYPSLIIDQAHQLQASNNPPAYQFAPTPGIRLETGQFQFKYGTSPMAPHTIQLILSKSRVYEFSRLPQTNLYVLDGATLEPLRGEPFSGFRPMTAGCL